MNTITKGLLTATAVVALAGTVSACQPADGEQGKVKSEGSAVVKESADKEKPEPEPEMPELGDTVSVGSWDVKVTEVEKNADEVIKHSNPFNEKAKGQFVMVTYDATYTGKNRMGDVDADLTWTITGADNQVYDNAAWMVDPSDRGTGWPTATRAGGTVSDIVTFDVPPAQIDGSIISVEAYGPGYRTQWADFPLA